MNDIRQLRICVQQLHAIPSMHKIIARNLADSDLRAIFLNNSLWKLGSNITVSFQPSTNNNPEWYDISMIEQAAKQNSEQVDPLEYSARKLSNEEAVETIVKQRVVPQVPGLVIKFVPSGGMVRIRFDSTGGSSSLVGTQCFTADPDNYTMTFGWMDVATIIHEFSHALGMLHEHQNPKGGIQWNRKLVYQWAKETQGWDKQTTDINILDTYSLNQITGSIFDPKSIMLYFFPSELTLNHVGTRQNHRYSQTDIAWLNAMYPSGTHRLRPVYYTTNQKQHSTRLWWIILCVAVIALIIVLVIKMKIYK